MKFGIIYNTAHLGTDPTRLAAVARRAEECGFESFYVPEHVALYPGARVGPYEFPSSLAVADPLECLSFVAAVTTRISLGTSVLLVPLHHPVVLAKRLSTLDLLSSGRLDLLTVGVGALPGEAAAVGVDFHTRGRRADETIDVLRLLWAGDEHGVSFDGEFYRLSEVCSFPKPYAAPADADPCRWLESRGGPTSRHPRRRLLPRRRPDSRQREPSRWPSRALGGSWARWRSRDVRVHRLGIDRADGRTSPGAGRGRCHAHRHSAVLG